MTVRKAINVRAGAWQWHPDRFGDTHLSINENRKCDVEYVRADLLSVQ